jgi:nuclear receptor subfamily 5 group A protein 3
MRVEGMPRPAPSLVITLSSIPLAAIREDRARGGRSSYDGCSPHGRPKPADADKRRVLQIRNVQQQQQQKQANLLTPVASTVTVTSDFSEVKVANRLQPQQVQPVMPQLLEDLSAVESLMMEEEEEHQCCAGKLQEGDTQYFSSLLHIADHCLYKIVRWARNLPDFANVSVKPFKPYVFSLD